MTEVMLALACQKVGDQNLTYIIGNIYAPNPNNNDKIVFFENVLNVIAELETLYNCSSTIIMGDYNLIFKKEESKNRLFSSQEKNVSRAVKQMFVDASMHDIWESSPKFTWRRANSNTFSTIDRIFYAKDDFEMVKANTNWSLSFSDHAAVELHLNQKNTCLMRAEAKSLG